MFTQSMPALAQALSGALPEAALRQLMQSLGNCQQPLTHRGSVNIQPSRTTGVGGLARPGTWRTSDYQDLLPTAGRNGFFDIAGGFGLGGASNNTNNYDGHQFYFPIDQAFNYSNYYGGDTFNVAGNSTFDNSTVNNLTAGDISVRTITLRPGGGGSETAPSGLLGGAGGGGANQNVIINNLPAGGGFGGTPPSVPQPAATQVATFLKDVSVTGNVNVPTVGSASIKDASIDIAKTTETYPFSTTGTVDVPVAQSGKIGALTATGKITFSTVTGGKFSGASASGTVSYDTYATAKVGAVTGTVSVPTTGSFSATPSGIAASGGLGTLTGKVTFDIPTGGYLDASCKLVLTTTSVTQTVVFSGAPSASITNQGTVSGSVTLSGDTSRALSISGPTVTLNKTTGTTSPTFNVTGGTFEPTTGSTTQDVSISTAAATIEITNNPQTFTVTSGGEVKVPTVTSASLKDSTVSLTPGEGTHSLNLNIAKKSDFLIYLRPRA